MPWLASRHRLRLVDAATGGPYLDRWGVVLFGGRCNVMLHHISGTDAREPHDHPWSFVTTCLRGGYDERWFADLAATAGEGIIRRHRWLRPRRMRRGQYHAVVSTHGDVWTLVIAARRRDDWGFAMRTDGGGARHLHFTDPGRERAHRATIEWGRDG